MKNTANISLCIVTGNNAEHLPITLSTVYPLINEIIVIDLGSVDGTQRIAREFDATVIDGNNVNYAEARKRAYDQAHGDWILQLDPGHELVGNNIRQIHRHLSTNHFQAYYLKEYSLENPDDFYYKPCLYRKMSGLEFNPVIDEGPILFGKQTDVIENRDSKIGLLREVVLYHHVKELRNKQMRNTVAAIKAALDTDPHDVELYYRLALLYRRLGQENDSRIATQNGIQVLTEKSADTMLTISGATGLFGFFAEDLLRNNLIDKNTINSLVQLQNALAPDIRFKLALAKLLQKVDRDKEAIYLLQEAIMLALIPAWDSFSFYECFVEPVCLLLEILHQRESGDELLKTIVNIQALAEKQDLNIRSVFTYLNEFRPDLLNFIDGMLKQVMVKGV